MVKTKRLRKIIFDYLSREGDKCIPEIEEFLAINYKHGSSYHALSNIMPKSGLFEKKGNTDRAQHDSGHYKVVLWGVKPGAKV